MSANSAPHPDRSAEQPQGNGITKDRVAALFDGIVAITATLLILDIAIPESGATLTIDALLASGRDILHWGVSFLMVAVIWTEFHVVFAHSRKWDGGLLIGTFAQMAVISLIPFASQVMGNHPDSVLAALLFSGVMGLNGLLVSINLALLQRKSHLHVAAHTPGHLRRRRRAQMLIYPLGVALSFAAATVHDPVLGVLAWVLCPIALAVHLRRVGVGASGLDISQGAQA